MWSRVMAIGQGRKAKDVPALPPIQHPARGTTTKAAPERAPQPNQPRRLSVAGFQEQWTKEVTST